MNKTLISNKLIVLFTILLTGFINQSCTYRVIDFTAISSKNVTLNLPENSKGQRVKGQDYVTTFLGIPWGSPNLKEATDQAIESAGGEYDALIDGVVYQNANGISYLENLVMRLKERQLYQKILEMLFNHLFQKDLLLF